MEKIVLTAVLIGLLLLPTVFADVTSVSGEDDQNNVYAKEQTRKRNSVPSDRAMAKYDPLAARKDIPTKPTKPGTTPATSGSSSGTSSGGGSSRTVARCNGDMNGDRIVDVSDLNSFSITWNKWNMFTGREFVFLSLSSSPEPETIKDEGFLRADMNGDGQLNNEDINDFAMLVFQGTACKA